MIVAVTANAGRMDADLDPRFGRCSHFVILNTESKQIEFVENDGTESPSGAGVQAAQRIIQKNTDALITGHVGPKAFDALKAAGIKIHTLEGGSVKDALAAFESGVLTPVQGATVTSHHGAAAQKSNTNETRKVAVAAESDDGLDAIVSHHFGRCPFYVMVDLKGEVVHHVESLANPFFNAHSPGQVPAFINEQQANVIISGGMGARAVQFFDEYGIEAVTGAQGKISEVIQAYLAGNIEGTEPCSHDDHEGCH